MPDQSDEILSEAKGAHQTAQELLPLLDLLNDPEGVSPLDEIKHLLQAILEILGHHQTALQRIESSFASVPPPSH
uniref:Uncharacterized protein n=1 Tax=Tardiphaga robiniae TaxID=943830 RepID=A0A109ZYD5_9BRAD|nr:hypothetical protein PROKKA_00723 [Tardiphaga robiniae]